MREIAGVEIPRSAGRWIVSRLREVGRADDATAAASIEYGLDVDCPVDWLTEEERAAVAVVLVSAPSSLDALRSSLAGDNP